jgi:membrane protease YdiL (CAAX protease family)
MVPDEGARGNVAPDRPRVVSALVALLVVFPLAQLVSWAAMILVMRATSSGAETSQEWFVAHIDTPLGILVMIVPMQAMILLATLFCVRNEEHRARALGLCKPALPMGVTVLLVLGTPAVQALALILGANSGLEPTPQLEMLDHLLRQSSGVTAWLFGVLATIVPACCEELFFRGLVQRRLAARFSPFTCVFVSGTVFALYHADPLHVVMIILPGLWFAYLAWRSRSTFVAMVAHLVFNAVGVTMGRFVSDLELRNGPPEIGALQAAILVFLLVGSLFALGAGLGLARARPRDDPSAE